MSGDGEEEESTVITSNTKLTSYDHMMIRRKLALDKVNEKRKVTFVDVIFDFLRRVWAVCWLCPRSCFFIPLLTPPFCHTLCKYTHARTQSCKLQALMEEEKRNCTFQPALVTTFQQRLAKQKEMGLLDRPIEGIETSTVASSQLFCPFGGIEVRARRQ